MAQSHIEFLSLLRLQPQPSASFGKSIPSRLSHWRREKGRRGACLEDAMASPVSRSSVAARFVASTLFACGCCFGTQSMADGQFHNGMRHSHRGWHAESDLGQGWGWDSSSGWYAGPFFNGNGRGYFRCFDPGYGWHSCPHYLPGNAALKPPKGWWRRHYMSAPPM